MQCEIREWIFRAILEIGLLVLTENGTKIEEYRVLFELILLASLTLH